jgi:hypothetical protein
MRSHANLLSILGYLLGKKTFIHLIVLADRYGCHYRDGITSFKVFYRINPASGGNRIILARFHAPLKFRCSTAHPANAVLLK